MSEGMLQSPHFVTPAKAGVYVEHGSRLFAGMTDCCAVRHSIVPHRLQRRLDANANSEQSAVLAVAADDHQTHRRGSRGLDRQTQRAAIEKIDDRSVTQQLEVE